MSSLLHVRRLINNAFALTRTIKRAESMQLIKVQNFNKDHQSISDSETSSNGLKIDFRREHVLPRLRLVHGTKYDRDEHAHQLIHVNETCAYLLGLRSATDGCPCDSSYLVDMFVERPNFGLIPLVNWQRVMDVLSSSYGLSLPTILSSIRQCPQIVESKSGSEMADAALSVVTRELFTGDFLDLLISNAPLLLVTSHSYISDRMFSLKFKLFPTHDLHKLLPLCPNLLFDDWDDITDVVQYVAFHIGLDQLSMMTTRVLSYRLDYIRLRHRLMCRTGKFKRLRTKSMIESANRKSQSTPINPHLSKMVDTNLTEFINFIGISMEEYKVFKWIYEMEIEEEAQQQQQQQRQQRKQLDEEYE